MRKASLLALLFSASLGAVAAPLSFDIIATQAGRPVALRTTDCRSGGFVVVDHLYAWPMAGGVQVRCHSADRATVTARLQMIGGIVAEPGLEVEQDFAPDTEPVVLERGGASLRVRVRK